MFKYLMLGLCMLAVVGCTPTSVIPRIEQADAAAEVEVDASLEFLVTRLCSLPIDILARNAADDPDMARAIYYGCPQVQGFMFSMLRAVGTDGFNVNVTIEE